MAQDEVIHGRGEAGGRQVQGEGEGVNGSSQESLRGAYISRRGMWYSYRWGRNEQAGQNSLLEELSGLQGYAPGLVFQDALCGFAMSAYMGTLALAGVLRVQGGSTIAERHAADALSTQRRLHTGRYTGRRVAAGTESYCDLRPSACTYRISRSPRPCAARTRQC
jgi:hypothetical protein